jgi:hypothetical protein
MREIAHGVLQIPLGYVNAYLVVTDDGLVLVDTGLPRRHAQIERALADAQRSVGEIRAGGHRGAHAGPHLRSRVVPPRPQRRSPPRR